MPSEKDLMDEHGLARETVRRAMALLRSEGLVDIRHGHGTRVKEPTEREVVRIPRYSHVLTRPATAAERAELGLRDGELVVEVRTGAKVSVYPADRTEFTTA
jgi:DNA-binding GntR family transcriptional regulator